MRLCALLLFVAAALYGCTPSGKTPSPSAEGAPPACQPSCVDHCGEDDGCGATCPACGSKSGDGCADTCESKAAECGEVCGQSCGSCEQDETCNDGKCACRPVCDGTRCDDGCGGMCECAQGTVCDASGACKSPEACTDTCQSAKRGCGDVCGHACGECGAGEACIENACKDARGCVDCALHLTVVDRKVVSDHITEVTLGVEYAPGSDTPHPRMADLRVRADRDVTLVSAEAGPALVNADKELYVDDVTDQPWKVRKDGSFQLLAFGSANTTPFVAGRMLTLKFRTNELNPIQFSLVRREQTLAPTDADLSLQGSAYDQAVVVSR
jgi:hypothetical protein